jgi:hypothetical protein
MGVQPSVGVSSGHPYSREQIQGVPAEHDQSRHRSKLRYGLRRLRAPPTVVVGCHELHDHCADVSTSSVALASLSTTRGRARISSISTGFSTERRNTARRAVGRRLSRIMRCTSIWISARVIARPRSDSTAVDRARERTSLSRRTPSLRTALNSGFAAGLSAAKYGGSSKPARSPLCSQLAVSKLRSLPSVFD